MQINKKKQKHFLTVSLSWFWIGIGLTLCLAPTIWSAFSNHQSAAKINTYQKQMSTLKVQDYSEAFEQATLWNMALAQEATLSEIPIASYEEQLQLLGNGVMGILKIPKISLSLPIYHGVEEEALSKGVGHLSSSSLPIGSSSARAVLSAHRGLMQAELFTRLDELKSGDQFWIENPKETLAYEVFEIQVILPSEKSALEIEPGKDLVTLMTCTPYGINDHRLLVTGKRIPYLESLEALQKTTPTPTSWMQGSTREILFRLWPYVLILFVIGIWLYQRLFFHRQNPTPSK